MENLSALFQHEGIDAKLADTPVSAGGQPLSPHALRVLLLVMMLQLREPRATLWPFPNPEVTGDIFEAAVSYTHLTLPTILLV
eukprot:8230059-Pyramimonas_sp.AAC.1